MKKVKQITIDILVDEDKDGCVLAEQIARDLESTGNIVLGSTFQTDITDYYKGEEICPYCDHINEYVWDCKRRKITCVNCGKEILLCSLCNMDESNCGKCPYEEEE